MQGTPEFDRGLALTSARQIVVDSLRSLASADQSQYGMPQPPRLTGMNQSLKQIPANELRWMGESFVDPNGRVFEWRGEIYRVLEAEYAARWRELAAEGTMGRLIADGLLVDSDLTSLTTETGMAVLHHRRVPVISYCYEWTPGMLKEAALLTIDLCIRLAERGLTLQDGHPWNILFEGTKPIYIDAGSLVPARDDILWAPYQQFCNFFLFPLYLYAAGWDHIARWLMRDYLAGVSDTDLLAALPASFKLLHPQRTLGVAIPKAAGTLFEHLPEYIQRRFLSISKIANSGPGQGRLKHKFFSSLRENIASLKLNRQTSHALARPVAIYTRRRLRFAFRHNFINCEFVLPRKTAKARRRSRLSDP